MKKIISASESVKAVSDGDTILVGGFLNVGTPETLVDALQAQGTKNLTLVANDTSYPDQGVGKLVVSDQFKKVIVSHIGTNKYSGEKMHKGEMEVNLVPQGTLVEQIRAAGAGLGGILTPTGIGTKAAENKKVLTVNEKEYILAEPIYGDVALIKAEAADEYGNLVYRLSARNFNHIMAQAAKVVIAEVGKVEKPGVIAPDHVTTPGVYVDYLVEREG